MNTQITSKHLLSPLTIAIDHQISPETPAILLCTYGILLLLYYNIRDGPPHIYRARTA